ncbi:MAG: alpha/beta fold hydrolase [Myxococcales bacterium]|nr:alpha/beta fold hydrolase [Myxococcales bacterium]
MRSAALLLFALATSGCFKLDPFLYEPERKEKYDFEPDGGTPEETVTADRIEPVRIEVDATLSLGAVYLRGSVQPPLAHVIFFHGKGGHLDKAFPRAKRWANLGFDVLAFDYRGWGNSTAVTPTEAGIEQDTRAVLAWMVARVGADRLVYYGQSFGTATSTQRAELDPPRALILESGFASVQAFARDSTQMDFPASFIANDGWDTEGRLGNVRAPVLILHGLSDDFVRPEFSQALYEAANQPKKLILVEGGGHSDLPKVMGEEYGEAIRSFVAAHLR